MFVALRAHNVLDDLHHVIDSFAPDLVLRKSAEFASWAIAERRSIPHVAVALGAGESSREWGLLADPWFAELGERVGLESLDATSLYRHGLVSFAPARYHDRSDTPGARTFRPASPSARNRVDHDDAVDEELAHFDGRSVVYATMGTEFFSNHVMSRIVSSVGAAGAVAVVTTGRGHDPAVLDTGSTDVVRRRWVDQDRVLSRVAAVVSHGGAGTVAGALCHGVPLVVVPQGADQFAHARRVEELGVGIAVPPSASNSELDNAVASVLHDERFRTATLEIPARRRSFPASTSRPPRR